MTVERGIVFNGRLIANTEWCLRDTKAWWETGERGTRSRAGHTVSILVGHWTAGEAGVPSPLDDGPRVVSAMKARKRPDGSMMDVAIHFVLGGCADPADGEETGFAPVWQTTDLAMGCVHIGDRLTNRRSIGVERVLAGVPGDLDSRHRPQITRTLVGKPHVILNETPAQKRAYQRLANALTSLPAKMMGIAIPRIVPVGADNKPFSDRFTRAQQKSWAGAQEHMHVPKTTKIDAGTLTLESLLEAGWAPQKP